MFLVSFLILALSTAKVHGHNNGTSSDLSEWLTSLYDQHRWLTRLNNGTIDENAVCKRHMEMYVTNLLNGSLWAVKMFDASGRYNSQFFFGNDYWLGSSALCDELANNDTNWQIPPFELHYYVARIRLNVNVIPTPAPRLIHLGLCLPRSCRTDDVRALLVQETSDGRASLNVTNVRSVPGDYSLMRDVKFQIIGISGSITIFLIIVASVVEVVIKNKRNKLGPKDAERNGNGPNQRSRNKEVAITAQNDQSKLKGGGTRDGGVILNLLLSFSAIKNGRRILSTSAVSKDVIACLHGLRVFSIAWIIMVHTYLQVFGVAKNKGLRTLTERKFIYQTIANATYSVDTFFFISGLLVTLQFLRAEDLKDRTKEKTFGSSVGKFALMLAYRFVRLTPPYLFVLGVNEIVMRYVYSNSVFTPAFIDHITCDKYWWRNALYINNFFPQKEFCMLWSWYIANDTQFYVIASVLLLIVIRGGKQVKYVGISISVLLLASWIVTFVLAIRYRYVARVQEPFALFDVLYDKPWMRIGPYLIGMLIGYALFKRNGKIRLTCPAVLLGWTLSLTCLGSLVYGMGKSGLVIPVSAFYVSLGHTGWALSLAWITVACSSGYGGPFETLFSCKMFLPLSRLTYCAYLVHPVLMFVTSFALDGSLQIHNILTIVLFFGNAVLSFICAFGISIAFEAPAINLLKMVL